MSKYLLKTKCPACEDEEIKTWRHNSEKCGGAYYIDEDLYLHCNKCNDKTFFFVYHLIEVNMISESLYISII